MKTLTLQIPDEVYERVQQLAATRGATVAQQLVNLLDDVTAKPEEDRLATARARMSELFGTVKGFRLAPAIPREELHERGSLR